MDKPQQKTFWVKEARHKAMQTVRFHLSGVLAEAELIRDEGTHGNGLGRAGGELAEQGMF